MKCPAGQVYRIDIIYLCAIYDQHTFFNTGEDQSSSMNFTVLFHLPTIVSTLVVDAINQSTLTYMLKLALNKICESNYMSQDLSGTTHESFHTNTIVCQYPTHAVVSVVPTEDYKLPC